MGLQSILEVHPQVSTLIFSLCSFVAEQNVLYTLGQLANEFPEVQEALQVRLQEADLRLPSKPPAKVNATGMGSAPANASNIRVNVVNRSGRE